MTFSLMRLTDLPDELLHLICEHLDEDLDSLLSLAILNQSLNRIALGKYYSVINFDQEETFLGLGTASIPFRHLQSFMLDLRRPQFTAISAHFSLDFSKELDQLVRIIQSNKLSYTAYLSFPYQYRPSEQSNKLFHQLLCTVSQSPCNSIAVRGKVHSDDFEVPPIATLENIDMDSSSFLVQPSLLSWIVQSANSSSSLRKLTISCEIPSRFLSQLHLPELVHLNFDTKILPPGGFDEFSSFLIRHPSIQTLSVRLNPDQVPTPYPVWPARGLPNLSDLLTNPVHLQYLLSSDTLPALKSLTLLLAFSPELESSTQRALMMTETMAKISDHVSISTLQFDITESTRKDDWFDVVSASSLAHVVDVTIRFTLCSIEVPEYLPLIPKWLGGFLGLKAFGCPWIDMKDKKRRMQFMTQLAEHCPNLEIVSLNLDRRSLESWLKGEDVKDYLGY
ncbi:hypothetical protein C8J56DRAFT_989394 [Mycena floridula]|nr:hypothetical protein C8J56DRAFT_989394 [Mycena floridula]